MLGLLRSQRWRVGDRWWSQAATSCVLFEGFHATAEQLFIRLRCRCRLSAKPGSWQQHVLAERTSQRLSSSAMHSGERGCSCLCMTMLDCEDVSCRHSHY